MVASESVQFFQFDQQGNMYVFEPGAGCTGNATLVKPGDELIFDNNSPSNVTGEQISQSDSFALSGMSCASGCSTQMSTR